MTNNSDHSDFVDLADKKHYIETMEFTAAEMLSTFDTLTCNYIALMEEHYNRHSKEFADYILLKGHNMLCSVFELTLLYTNNLLVTCNTVQRSVLLFCEFVSQINHDKYNYLRLSIRDAVLFVYKKTIYRLNTEQACLLTSTEQGRDRHRLLDKHHTLTSVYLKNYLDSNIGSDKDCLTDLSKRLQRLDKKLLTICFQVEQDETLHQIAHTILEIFNVISSKSNKTEHEINHFNIQYDASIRILSYLKSCINKKQNILDIVFKIQNRLYRSEFLHFVEMNQIDNALKFLIKN